MLRTQSSWRRPTFCLALAGAFFAAISLALSTMAVEPPDKFVVVPVYFLTDRNRTGETFGSQRKYITHCKHDMYYGTAYVPVANKELKSKNEKFAKLGWTTSNTLHRGPSVKRRIDDSNPVESKKQFFELIAHVLDQSGKNELGVFVHGADDAFEDAASDAAQLSYYLERPIVLYSWPSVPKMLGYMIDGGNNEYSQGHFNMFLSDLLQFREHHPLEVIMLSHSMGNRLVVRSVPLIAGTELIKDAELISPDVDEETFKHYILGMRYGKGGTLRLYVSYRDKMLPLSQMLYGGYYRLGEGVGAIFDRSQLPALRSIVPPGGAAGKPASISASTDSGATQPPVRIEASTTDGAADPAEGTTINGAKSGEGESASPPKFGLSGNGLSFTINGEGGQTFDLSKLLNRIEGINFTALDTGFSGHSIPFKLIGSMLATDSPPPGYKLVPAKMRSGSKLARFFSRKMRAAANGSNAGAWQAVVKADQ